MSSRATAPVAGEPLVTHPKVAKVAFTGGSATGARVNELAAKTFKKVSLELGGKSPNIVFDDCILDDAVSGAVSGIFAATGQTCIAGSRLLLQETHPRSVRREARRHGEDREARRSGASRDAGRSGNDAAAVPEDPLLHRHRQGRGRQVRAGRRARPARRKVAGKYFVKPTIFTGVNNKMRIAQEEVFGPVLSVIKFKDEEEAVAIANDIAYGLGAGVWTQSVKRATPWRSASRPARCGSTPTAR